ncbi:MAG: DUF4349 domain-containing protein [Propionibacteriaceae bacterium]|jgi:hypothetical protein|nr:DUF4349 domain-containing protein [Propionibacteriaceae bacterium]
MFAKLFNRSVSTRRDRRQLLALFAAGLLGLGLLTACSGPSSSPDYGAPAVGDGVYPEDAGGPEAGQDDLTLERQIARTASLSLVVDDVRQGSNQLTELAERMGGLVTNQDLSLPTEENPAVSYSTLELSVPSDRLDEAMEEIANLGEVTDQSVTAKDVTSQVVDVDSRIETLRQSIARLQTLMGQSGSVSDIAAVESELTSRQAQLESLLSQQKALSDSVEMAPITVYLRTPGMSEPNQGNGFIEGLKSGWASLAVAATIIGALIPWLVIAAVVVAAVVIGRRLRRRSASVDHSRQSAQGHEEGPSSAAVSQEESVQSVAQDGTGHGA